MTAASMLLLAEPGFASDLAADANLPAIILPGADAPAAEEKADLRAEAETPVADSTEIEAEPDPAPPALPVTPASLAQLVAVPPRPAAIDPELRCLAGAVYFESRGDSLPGPLAVPHVVINRAQSAPF